MVVQLRIDLSWIGNKILIQGLILPRIRKVILCELLLSVPVCVNAERILHEASRLAEWCCAPQLLWVKPRRLQVALIQDGRLLVVNKLLLLVGSVVLRSQGKWRMAW